MKWFFGLNEFGNEFEDYSKMLKVALHTAKNLHRSNRIFSMMVMKMI